MRDKKKLCVKKFSGRENKGDLARFGKFKKSFFSVQVFATSRKLCSFQKLEVVCT